MQEADRAAAAARSLLPFAVLAPACCMRRLVLDAVHHSGQQSLVLLLLGAFATAASAPVPPQQPPVGRQMQPQQDGSGVTTTTTYLMACLQNVLVEAKAQLPSASDERALLSLLSGLVRAGLLRPRDVLSQLAVPLLRAPDTPTAAVSLHACRVACCSQSGWGRGWATAAGLRHSHAWFLASCTTPNALPALLQHPARRTGGWRCQAPVTATYTPALP